MATDHSSSNLQGPCGPALELSWQTYCGNVGQNQPPRVRNAYVAAFCAGWAAQYSFAHETPVKLPPNVRRYKVQQDKGIYCLKGCDDGDLVDYSAYEALLRRLNQPSAVKAGGES